jgi:cyclophilin family peptidyl-prolyl cis-trans isomerase
MANRNAVLETTKGTIRVELDEEHAPATAANFIELAERGFYDGLTFHRHVPGFVIQGGDPSGNGTGGSGKQIKLETTGVNKHTSAGTIAMARSQHPDSASSQFYFTLASAPHLDGSYATFGKVTDGLDAVMSLREGDRMTKVTIVDGAEGA